VLKTISPYANRPVSRQQEIENNHQLRLAVVGKEEERGEFGRTREGKGWKPSAGKVEQANEREVPLK
jgi:hypothetical protein